MDRCKLSRIDEGLGSSEVAALCFLCLDVVNKKRLEGVSTTGAKMQQHEAFSSQCLHYYEIF